MTGTVRFHLYGLDFPVEAPIPDGQTPESALIAVDAQKNRDFVRFSGLLIKTDQIRYAEAAWDVQ